MDIGHLAKVVATGLPTLITGGKPAARAGADRLAFARPELSAPQTLTVQSAAFDDGQPIPTEYTPDGRNTSPPISWSGIPSEARSLALVVEDPDAPLPEPYVHWLAYNIEPTLAALRPGIATEERLSAPSLLQGKNSALKIGYTGAAPPKGDDPHRYFFQLFALNAMLALDPGAGRTKLFEAMAGRVLARGQLIGTYQR